MSSEKFLTFYSTIGVPVSVFPAVEEQVECQVDAALRGGKLSIDYVWVPKLGLGIQRTNVPPEDLKRFYAEAFEQFHESFFLTC